MQSGKEQTESNGAAPTDKPHGKANRLIHEKSPYLLQHAYNPVDWYAWGDEALETARRKDKPIFLSIGYSTCHWCHVMERESFENEETARLMNDTFVSVKVDREERPDIDHIYMTVCQMMTGGGGWPLTIIMTPDKRPFFAGTYLPKESRSGRMGMDDLCRRVKALWTTKRGEVLESASRVTEALQEIPDDAPGEAPGPETLSTAYGQLVHRFDARFGGFSQAPKFPTPHNLLFLLRYWKRAGEPKALHMVEKTLDAMRQGGIYDHVGFGFHRYSTDGEWLVPHFEKMLYDQAMLAMAYIEAYQATGKTQYEKTANEIFAYVLRDMTSPEGGFYGAEDADSEGEEGRFYVWRVEEIRRVLEEREAEVLSRTYNLQAAGNFREEATGRVTGNNILHLKKPLGEIANEFDLSQHDLEQLLQGALQKLFRVRERRIRPHRDDKILTDWNGLMVAAFARGHQVLERPEYAEAAKKAADFVLTTLRGANGRLLHRYREGQAGMPATVDDYAFFIWGLLDLYEATFEVRYLKSALDLNRQFMERFWDPTDGGFYFTPDDAKDLIVRRKEIYDGATPSGNSVAALNLLRLGRMVADPDLERKADLVARAFSGNIHKFPSAYTQFLVALEFATGPAFEVVIVGRSDGQDTKKMLAKLRKPFVPNKVVLLRPAEAQSPDIAAIASYTGAQRSIEGRATAYVCLNYNCELPTTDPEEMVALLGVK